VYNGVQVWYSSYYQQAREETMGGNTELAKAMMGKRLSSAASKHHDRRTKRVRTRAAKKQRAIRDAS
jgi:hypothetical protein